MKLAWSLQIASLPNQVQAYRIKGECITNAYDGQFTSVLSGKEYRQAGIRCAEINPNCHPRLAWSKSRPPAVILDRLIQSRCSCGIRA
jgi:hypothetical protein